MQHYRFQGVLLSANPSMRKSRSMHLRFRNLLLAATPLAIAACAAGGSSSADVTRFHLGAPVARTTVYLEPMAVGTGGSLEFRSYAAASAPALQAAGFTVANSAAEAELIGVLGFTQTVRPGFGRGSGVSIGIGGGTSIGRNVGIGAGVTLPVGQAKPNDMVVSLYDIRLRRRSDSSVVWEGRAVAEAKGGSADAQPANIVPRLARATFANFPGPSGQTVKVKL
jgi:hypothetical protein